MHAAYYGIEVGTLYIHRLHRHPLLKAAHACIPQRPSGLSFGCRPSWRCAKHDLRCWSEASTQVEQQVAWVSETRRCFPYEQHYFCQLQYDDSSFLLSTSLLPTPQGWQRLYQSTLTKSNLIPDIKRYPTDNHPEIPKSL